MEGSDGMNTSPMPETMPGEKPKGSSAGPVVGAIIIIVIIVLGGLYFWGKKLAEAPVDEETLELQEVNSSDDLADIEADLENTELDSLDSDFGELEAELEGEAAAQ
jgi:hypothetical protein